MKEYKSNRHEEIRNIIAEEYKIDPPNIRIANRLWKLKYKEKDILEMTEIPDDLKISIANNLRDIEINTSYEKYIKGE